MFGSMFDRTISMMCWQKERGMYEEKENIGCSKQFVFFAASVEDQSGKSHNDIRCNTV